MVLKICRAPAAGARDNPLRPAAGSVSLSLPLAYYARRVRMRVVRVRIPLFVGFPVRCTRAVLMALGDARLALFQLHIYSPLALVPRAPPLLFIAFGYSEGVLAAYLAHSAHCSPYA